MKKIRDPHDPMKSKTTNREILSISPAAPGWRAVMFEPSSDSPVVSWALVKHSFFDEEGPFDLTYVTPIIPEIGEAGGPGTALACMAPNFVGVSAPDQDPEDVRNAHRNLLAIEAAEAKALGLEDASS